MLFLLFPVDSRVSLYLLYFPRFPSKPSEPVEITVLALAVNLLHESWIRDESTGSVCGEINWDAGKPWKFMEKSEKRN